MDSKAILKRDDIMEIHHPIVRQGDLHDQARSVTGQCHTGEGHRQCVAGKVHAIGQGLAQALGKLGKHGVKQVDRLLSNEGVS